MEEQEGIEASEGGAVEVGIGALETMDDSQPARSPSMPSSSAEAEEAPVFDHAATLGPAGDLASDVYGLPSIEQSSEGEDASATLWPTDQSIEKPSLPPEDYSQTTGSPSMPLSAAAPAPAPVEDEKAPLFGHAAALGPTIASGDRGGDEGSDVQMPQSIAKHEGTDLGAQEMDDSQLLGTSAVRHSASEEEAKEAVVFEPSPVRKMDDSEFLDSSAPPHSAFAEEGKKSGAFEAAPEHGMDDSPFLGSCAATQSASVVEDKEAATADEGKGGTVEVEVGAQEMDDSQLLGFDSVPASASSEEDEEAPVLEPSAPGGFTIAAGDDAAGEDEVQMDVELSEPVVDAAPRGRVGRRGGRKRGRPPMVQAARAPAKRRKEKEKEKEKRDEEVCFICFDGGDLVVCDRRGCPKVYHPSCVNRDEAFFRAKGRWNCGWHICSSCEKSAQYMCYTCTFSLCKGCISEAGFVRVRGNKGFCVTCLSTVMLIESIKDGIKKMDGIDFDDKSSWMSFFKDYWLDLKGKLSLTSEELTRARTPSKESNEMARNESSDDLYKANDDREASSDSSSGRLKGSISSRKKAKKRSRNIATDEGSTKDAESEGTSPSGDVNWASIELLEFVAHMKDGDKSALSQYDVQALLLDYIKRSNLRDPRKKSYIICDSRLQNLFGKTRVGHFEMLKLLESHFLTKEPSPVITDDNQEGVVDPEPSQMDTEGNSDASTMMPSDRRRKARKRVHEKEPQTNLDDYAAIDVHNINVMYLRRNLMEDLIDDIDTFGDKVVGSFVRIRISGSGQRQDIYRLVQVIGTGNAAKKYRTGKKTTDFTLEISNLNKTEFITIDIISNQEFTEEECRRLRQSIKCGFISPLTVGEVQEKARVLQALRVNDWLESEKLRLGNLRDRASEKGRRKELRECVEKLQLLSTPEERMRRLNEAPEIHSDPKMDPDYESSEDEGEPDDRQQDNSGYPRESSFLRKGSDGISPGKGDYISSNNWNSPRKSTWETNRSAPTESTWDLGSSTSASNRTNQSSLNQVHQTSSLEAPRSQANAIGSEVGPSNNNQFAVKSGQSSAVPSETTSAPLSAGVVAPTSTSETEKMWHYQDPSGKVQGPFSMTQLRKWNKSGYFPTSLSIWRTSEKHEDSILLSDALVGKYQKDLPQLEPQYNTTAQPVKVAANRNDASSSSTGINESARTGMWAAQPSACSLPRSEVVNTSEGRPGITSGGWQSSKDFSGQPQGPNSPRPVAPFSANPYRPPPYQGRGGRGRNTGRWNGGQDYQNNWNSNRPPSGVQPGGQGYEMQRPNWSSSSQQSPAGHWNNQPANNPLNQWRGDSNNLSTPQPSIVGWPAVQGALNNPSPPTAPIQPMVSGWGTTPKGNGAEPPTAIVGPNITTLTTNPVGGWGSNSLPYVHLQTLIANAGNSFPTAFASVVKTAETADSVQIPAKMDSSGYTQMPNEQKRPSEPDTPIVSKALQLPCGEMITQKSSATVLSASESNGFRAGSDKNQSLEGARIGPNPTSQQGASDVRAPSQSNVRQALPATSTNRESNPQLDTAPSEAHQPSVQQQQHGVAEIKPVVASGTSELASAQGSEATSDLRLETDGSNINPACAANVRESTRSPKPSQSLSGPVPVNPSNLEVLPEKNSSERPMQPPVPTTRRSKWDTGADSNAGNSQTSHLVSPNTSQLPPSSQWKTSTTLEAAQPSNGGLGAVPQHPSTGTGQAQGNSNMMWGSETAQPTNSGLGVVPQNPITGTGPAQGNSNMIWGAAVQGAANVGWGVVAQGSTNVVWGIPAQENPNLNVGWGTAVQANANASTGYGVPAQGDTIVNMAWGTPAQGSTNPNAGWGAPTQGNATPNPGWVAPTAQGYPNPNLGSGAPTPGITNQNVSWAAAPVDGNSAANAGWGAGQGNTNPTWNPSATNPNTPSTQQNQSGDRPSGESGHDGGRQSWNRMQSDGRGGSSRPPPRGGGGVCRFHESGHCKKGASCNYVHL